MDRGCRGLINNFDINIKSVGYDYNIKIKEKVNYLLIVSNAHKPHLT